MNVLYYSNTVERGGDRFVDIVHRQLPTVQIEQVTSIGRFYDRLCQPLNRISAIVTLLRSPRDLEYLFSLKPRFDQLRLIIIVPDEVVLEQGSIQRLAPCYVCYSEHNFGDVVSVLGHILKKIGGR
jgi:hypothetical protein